MINKIDLMDPSGLILVGRTGENAFRTITFDASTWGADFPDATYTVVYKRSDGYIYPVLVNAAADAIVWSPTDTDTAVSGNGQIEVRLLDGETIGKTIVMQTFVAPSLSGDESEPSTPAPDWVNDVAADADRAELAVTHYPKIVNGVWYVWDVQSEDFISTGIEAQGEEGYSPTVTITAIDGGHRVTITDADGAHTFDVLDGVGGSDAVESVNGKTGVVVLDATDVHALPDSTVIPVVPQMATAADMSDWTSGKTVDAAVLKEDFTAAALELNDLSVNKADRTDIPTAVSELTNDSGFVTAQQAAAAAPVQSVNGMTGAVSIQTGGNVDSVNGKTGVVTLTASDVGALPSNTPIPSAVTEQTVAQWGFTKNTGTYSKPSGGIPKTDLSSDVQASLDKADTALQQHQSLAGYATETWVQNRGYQTAQDVSLAILAADPPLELIRTYTCDGTETTTSAFYITEDDDGNAFRLKKLVMRVTLGTVSASGTFSANALSGSKIIAQSYSSYGASASGQRYELVCRQDSGYWRMEQFPFASATGNIGFNHDYSFKDSANQYLYIDRVRLTRAVPAGTVIELFGVPYDSNGIQPAESNSFGGGA